MSKYKTLSHVIFYHVYHIVWTPKYRYRVLDGQIKEFVDKSIRSVCKWKRIEILEMNIQQDHVHLVISIEPRMSVSEAMGILKRKTAIKIFKSFPGLKKRPYWGNQFSSRGYSSSTIGLEEEKIRKYVKYQEEQERHEEVQQLGFDF